MIYQFTDSVALDGKPRRTRDGYMLIVARTARTGIQTYSGGELQKPELGTVRVLRPEDEVFSDKALRSFAHRPVTVDHPEQMVTSANWKDASVGTTGDRIVRDGDHVQLPLC